MERTEMYLKETTIHLKIILIGLNMETIENQFGVGLDIFQSAGLS